MEIGRGKADRGKKRRGEVVEKVRRKRRGEDWIGRGGGVKAKRGRW